MDRQLIIDKLSSTLPQKRFVHSLNVADTAVKLAQRYGADTNKADIAGLLHDCAKNIKGKELEELCAKYKVQMDYVVLLQPQLLHGRLGAHITRDVYGIKDEDIFNAIYYHTTGRGNMSILEKVVFMADYIEPGRDFEGIDNMRKICYEDIDSAIVMSIEDIILNLIKKRKLIHPDALNARNYILGNSGSNQNEKKEK